MGNSLQFIAIEQKRTMEQMKDHKTLRRKKVSNQPNLSTKMKIIPSFIKRKVILYFLMIILVASILACDLPSCGDISINCAGNNVSCTTQPAPASTP